MVWRNGWVTDAPRDDNPHVYREDGRTRFFPRLSDIEPARLRYIDPHDLSGITWPWMWGFDREPVAAASLGQVHVAYMPGGRKAAVKVLYPGIRDVVRVDLKVIGLMVRVYKWFVPVQNIEAVHESLVDLLRRETDYVHEADCMRRMAGNFLDDDHILFPEVI